MQTLQMAVPDELANQMDQALKAGWFTGREEMVRVALMEFLQHHRFELIERFQREDIAWALQQKRVTP